ncbi:MAG: PVC-type heme-binding CxxCH protein [Pirellulaceae bacterium]
MKRFVCVVSVVLAGVVSAMIAGIAAEPKTSNAPFLKPAEAVAKMSIPEGFEVKIFAAEPDLAEPIAFCFDDRGRMWVAENLNYRTRRQHTNDQVSRIQIFEDTDGDGVFDKKKLFTDKLTFTSGIAVGHGGVFVGSPPNFSFIPDVNGDDKPDGPPEPILDGWGINDRHETLNSFIWGPDGWLYGCHGVFTHSWVGKIGAPREERDFIDAGIWRYHPITGKFEIFARGLSNPWGFDFNDHGQGFATCCVIPHLFHVVQGGVYHKQSKQHVNPYIYDDIKTIRDHVHKSAHGGARFYLADTFPAKYRDRLFMCNIHQHMVLTDIMEPKGSSYIGKHGDDFMPINDLAWVGFSVETGPEGGVYILDWHDTDICGNAINFPQSGRIYRIMPKDAKLAQRPGGRQGLRSLSDADLVDLQMHSNDWYVRQSRVLLQQRMADGRLNKKAVYARLKKVYEEAPNSAKKLRALWALHVTGRFQGKDRAILEQYMLGNTKEEYIRAWAIQLLCEDGNPSGNVLKRFAELAEKDPSPVVRMYLAAALQRLEFDQRWPILEALAKHGEDVEDNNIPRLLWFALEPMVPKHAQQALKLAVTSKMPKLQEFVARRIAGGNAKLNIPRAPGAVSAQEQRNMQQAAPGFKVVDVGEKGVVKHSVFRNVTAVQTHPLNRKKPCYLVRELDVPKGKKTHLQMKVSHHPHGDWQLRVLAGKEVLADQLVSAKTVKDEWLEVTVDLSKYAGTQIQLRIENRANDWRNEWAYWHTVKVVSQ